MVTIANLYDEKTVEFLMRTLAHFLSPIKVILADGGYRGESWYWLKISLDISSV